MGTAYLDSSALIKVFEKPELVSPEALEIIRHPETTIVSSLWHLVDLAYGERTPAEMLVKNLITKNPKWLPQHTFIASYEVKNFVFKYYLRQPTKILPSMLQSFAQVQACYPALAEYGIPLDFDPLKFIQGFFDHPKTLADIKSGSEANVKARETIIQAKLDGRYDALKKKIFLTTISRYIPKRDAFGSPLTFDEIQNIKVYCWKNKSAFYKNCPALNAERYLTDFRASDRNKIPTIQDAIDLEHQICAIPYCDYFITGDGYVIAGNNFVRKKFGQRRTCTTIII